MMNKNPEISKYANKTKKAYYFPETNTKICAKCNLEKETTLFFKHKQTKDGFHSWCKNCCNIGNQKSRAKAYATFEGRIRVLLQNCKNSSVKRNQECSITKEDLVYCWQAQEKTCAYSGIEMTTMPSLFNSVSVERIDSNIGYIPSNTILVCNFINRMKSDFEYEMFYKLCKSVSDWLTNDEGDLVLGLKE